MLFLLLVFQAYYEPNALRKNLLLVTGAQATKVVLEKADGFLEATGVEFVCEGVKHTANARKEVILSTGMHLDKESDFFILTTTIITKARSSLLNFWNSLVSITSKTYHSI